MEFIFVRKSPYFATIPRISRANIVLSEKVASASFRFATLISVRRKLGLFAGHRNGKKDRLGGHLLSQGVMEFWVVLVAAGLAVVAWRRDECGRQGGWQWRPAPAWDFISGRIAVSPLLLRARLDHLGPGSGPIYSSFYVKEIHQISIITICL